ncbi:hypothetical protein CCACVL1_14225, partial [Corchorus capsularis]
MEFIFKIAKNGKEVDWSWKGSNKLRVWQDSNEQLLGHILNSKSMWIGA